MSLTRSERVQDLFDRAADLPPEAWGAFLREHCGGDQELQREVDVLLRADRRDTAAPLRGLGADASIMADAGVEAPERGGSAPERIGPYRILGSLGEGGFGTVYLAEQEKPIRRRVALKVLKAGMDSKAIVARFEQEREALSLMEHPGVARVLDAGVAERGLPYFVMEYVHGEPITAFCDRHRLGIEERVRLFIRVCDAVQHAHQKGVIHRDIKPGNILVGYEGQSAAPKVIDFGVAKALHRPLTAHTVYTEHGQMIGTPDYMSPEQAEMSGVDIDTRTDIYSLGVLLYELLTGTLPLDPKALRTAGYTALQKMIREQDPPRPSTRISASASKDPGPVRAAAENRRADTRSLTRHLRGDLDWIVMKCLEKDRSRRYEAASALAADLNRYLAHEPVSAGPPSANYKFTKFVERHRIEVAAAAVVICALVGSTAVSLGMYVRERGVRAELARSVTEQREQRKRAVNAEQKMRLERDAAEEANKKVEEALAQARTSATLATQEAEKAEAVRRFLQGMLASADPSKALGREVTVREVLDRSAQQVASGSLKEKPEVEAAVRTVIGGTYRSLGRYEDARTHLEAAYRLRLAALGADHIDTIRSVNNLGLILDDLGQAEESERLLRQSVEALRASLGDDAENTLNSTQALAWRLYRSEKWAEAAPLLERVRGGAAATLGPDSNLAIKASATLAATWIELGDFARAEAMLGEAKSASDRTLAPSSPDALWVRNIEALLCLRTGRAARAEEILRGVVRDSERVFGPDHPYVAYYLANWGWSLRDLKKPDEAEAVFGRCIGGRGGAAGDELRWVLDARLGMATVRADQKRYEDAGREAAECETTARSRFGKSSTVWQRSAFLLARIADETGRADEAAAWRSRVAGAGE